MEEKKEKKSSWLKGLISNHPGYFTATLITTIVVVGSIVEAAIGGGKGKEK